jgi:hypothetical protein
MKNVHKHKLTTHEEELIKAIADIDYMLLERHMNGLSSGYDDDLEWLVNTPKEDNYKLAEAKSRITSEGLSDLSNNFSELFDIVTYYSYEYKEKYPQLSKAAVTIVQTMVTSDTNPDGSPALVENTDAPSANWLTLVQIFLSLAATEQEKKELSDALNPLTGGENIGFTIYQILTAFVEAFRRVESSSNADDKILYFNGIVTLISLKVAYKHLLEGAVILGVMLNIYEEKGAETDFADIIYESGKYLSEHKDEYIPKSILRGAR